MTVPKPVPLPMLAVGLLLLTLCMATTAVAQQNAPVVDPNGHMGVGTTKPDPSAALDIASTTAGLLIPRMTSAQQSALVNPATGLLVFKPPLAISSTTAEHLGPLCGRQF